jgi:ABC-type Fe3+/spermidine/putrescine transport system ATPase subunit
LTSIYVTHDQSEALAISDWIIVMKDGKIIERGRPEDIYRRPMHVFTARFLGSSNLLPGKVRERRGAQALVETAAGPILGECADKTLAQGDKVEMSVRPEDIEVLPQGDATGAVAHNRISGRITLSVFAGIATEAEVVCNGVTFGCLLPYSRTADKDVILSFSPERARVLRADAGAGAVSTSHDKASADASVQNT